MIRPPVNRVFWTAISSAIQPGQCHYRIPPKTDGYPHPKDAPALLGGSTSTFHRWMNRAGDEWRTIKRGNVRLARFGDIQPWLEKGEA